MGLSRQIRFREDEELEIAALAHEERRSFSGMVGKLIDEALEARRGAEAKPALRRLPSLTEARPDPKRK